MRIEDRGEGQFYKIPDALQQQVIKTMNRYFITDPKAIEASREGIILELQRRIQPMVANMVKRIAWLEGEQIFKDQLKSVIDEETADILKTAMDYVKSIKLNAVKPINYDIDITTTTRTVTLPGDPVVNATGDLIDVYVNGMLQKITKNYTLSTNVIGKVDKIIFETELGDLDNVEMKCLSFS